MAHVRNLSTQDETEGSYRLRAAWVFLLTTFFFEAGSLLHMELAKLDWLAVEAWRPVYLPISSSSLPHNVATEAHCFSLVFDVSAGDQNPGLNPCLASTLLTIAPNPPNEENLNHNSCQIFIMFNNTFKATSPLGMVVHACS